MADGARWVPREPPLSVLAGRPGQKCTTLCPRLDRWLRGGVPTRHLTELTGEAGAAKTQLALQLLLAAQLPRTRGGLDGAAVYVHTEGRAPLARLQHLIDEHPNVKANLPKGYDPLDHVYLVRRGSGKNTAHRAEGRHARRVRVRVGHVRAALVNASPAL